MDRVIGLKSSLRPIIRLHEAERWRLVSKRNGMREKSKSYSANTVFIFFFLETIIFSVLRDFKSMSFEDFPFLRKYYQVTSEWGNKK